MARRACAPRVALIIAVGWAAGQNTSSNTTGPSPSPTPSPSPSPVNYQVQVQGQSGKFTVYNADVGQGDPNKVMVTMDALREVDAAGESVGTSGNVKHSIQTFAAQDFTIAPSSSANVNGVTATLVAFDSPVSSIGRINVDTYLFTQSGTVGPPGEQWTTKAGDVKWNIVLSDWTWCGCGSGNKQQTGAFIDVDVAIKGKQNANTQGGLTGKLDLGGGVGLELSSQVLVDGQWQAMPTGYPKVVAQGSSQVFTFRFPKFNTNATYDPLLSMPASPDASGGATTVASGSGSGGGQTTVASAGGSDGGATTTSGAGSTSSAFALAAPSLAVLTSTGLMLIIG